MICSANAWDATLVKIMIFREGSTISASESSAPSRVRRGNPAVWKHAQPPSTDFESRSVEPNPCPICCQMRLRQIRRIEEGAAATCVQQRRLLLGNSVCSYR